MFKNKIEQVQVGVAPAGGVQGQCDQEGRQHTVGSVDQGGCTCGEGL